MPRFRMRDLTAPRRKKRRRVLLGIVLLLVLLVVFAPAIIAHTSLINSLLANNLAAAGLTGSAEGASLGWFSPVQLTGITVTEQSGDVLCEVPQIEISQTLLSLAIDASDLGTIAISGPVVHVSLRSDGSNLEDAIAAYLASRDPNGRPARVKLQINDARIDVADRVRGEAWTLRSVDVACRLTGDSAQPVAELSAGGQVAVFDRPAGDFQIDLSQLTEERRQLELKIDALQLPPLAGLLERWFEGVRLEGELIVAASVQWSGAEQWQTHGDARFAGLAVSAAALGSDELVFREFNLPWRLSRQGPQLRIEQLEASCDAGEMNLRAEFPLTGATQQRWDAVSGKLEAQVDLSRLAALLPQTLALRGDVQVTSGTAGLSVRAEQVDSGRRLSGTLQTGNLVATRAGREIRWDDPIRVSVVANQTPDWKLDRLQLASSFVNGEASGDRDQFQADLAFDLDRLANELEQFVDLGTWRFAGTGRFTASWRPEPAAASSTALLSGRIDQLNVVQAGRPLFHEPSIEVAATAHINRDGGQLTLVRGGTLQVLAGPDRLTIEPQSDWQFGKPATDTTTVSELAVVLEGQLESWLARLEPWLESPPPPATGQVWMSGNLTQTGDRFQLGRDTVLRVDDLRLQLPRWQIDEQQLEVRTDLAEVHRDLSRIVLANCRIASSAASFEFPEVVCDLPAGGTPSVKGSGSFLTHLERLDSWYLGPTDLPRPWRVGGALEGQVELRHDAQGLHVLLDAGGRDIQVYRFVPATPQQQAGYRTVWNEPRAEMATRADVSDVGDIRLETLSWTGSKFTGQLQGTIRDLRGTAQLQLDGSLDYDLAELTALAQSYLGPGVRLTGREQARFEIQGALLTAETGVAPTTLTAAATIAPHWTRQLRIKTTAAWSNIDLYGLVVQPGRMNVTLANGAAILDPLEAQVGQEGILRAAARAVFDPQPGLIQLPQGEVVSRVHITPEVSDAVLKYIAPILARVTRSEGAFTVRMAGGQVPLDTPRKSTLGGQLVVHNARVQPGQETTEWLLLAEQVHGLLRMRQSLEGLSRPSRDWLIIEERVVDFHLADGRVHHRGLEFRSGDVVLRSQGSVGLDETLDILLEVPISEAWVRSDPWLRGLAGQPIRVRVGGTLSRPRLDRDALRQVSQQMLRGAARGVIGEGLNRALEGLLQPKP